MQLPAPFRAHGDHVAIDLDGATALFSTRRGGVSEGPFASLNIGRRTGDEGERVEANRERLAAQVGIDWGRFGRAIQVHETTVRHVARAPRRDDPWDHADGHATALPEVPLLVFVADCLPIALVAPGAVAMVHAGWRGLASGIVAQGIRALAADGPVRAVIGPGIGACCYEVDDDVRARFPAEAADGRRLDLKLAARRALEAAGVAEVHDAGLCTACHPELFFSHRRDRGTTGRQAGVVWRRG
ncbi:MAG TPA: polyphenol oxidase family protein [Solirubrobacteraceae bacterium]